MRAIMGHDVSIASERKYRGYVICTMLQDNGRKTYDIYAPDDSILEFAVERLAVAKATVDAELERLERKVRQ